VKELEEEEQEEEEEEEDDIYEEEKEEQEREGRRGGMQEIQKINTLYSLMISIYRKSSSVKVIAIKVHHLGPCSHEILHKLLL